MTVKNAVIFLFVLLVGGGCGMLLTRGHPDQSAIEGFSWGSAGFLLLFGISGILSRIPWVIGLRRSNAPPEDYARELANVLLAGISMVVGVVGLYMAKVAFG